MKKYLLTILTLFVFSITHATDEKAITYVFNKSTNAIEKVYSDGTKVVQEAYNVTKAMAPKIEQALESLGTSLKVSATQVWNILVKQQAVWSVCFLILTITAMINWYIFYRRYLDKDKAKGEWQSKITKEKDSYNREGKIIEEKEYIMIPTTPNGWFIGFHLVICLILSFFSFYHFTDMLTGFMNPEFGAMKTVAEIAAQIK